MTFRRSDNPKESNNEFEFVTHELDYYRSRWTATDQGLSQKMTMLLTAVGSAIVISAAVFVHGTKTVRHSWALMLGLWAVVWAISEGVFIRMVRGRQYIVRDITIANYIRDNIVDSRTDIPIQRLLTPVLSIDSTPPNAFSLFSTPSSAMMIAGASAFFSAWVGSNRLSSDPSEIDWIVGVGILAVNLSGNLAASRIFNGTLSKVPKSRFEKDRPKRTRFRRWFIS